MELITTAMNYIKINYDTPLHTGDVIVGKELIHFEIKSFDLVKQQLKIRLRNTSLNSGSENEYFELHYNSLYSGEWKKILVD